MERKDLLRLAGFLVGLLAFTGVIMLVAGGGSGGPGGAAGPRTQATADGRLTEVSAERLVLQPTDGSAPMTFAMRPEVARTIDLFHLQLHSRDQLPSRVYYETDGKSMYALRVDDA